MKVGKRWNVIDSCATGRTHSTVGRGGGGGKGEWMDSVTLLISCRIVMTMRREDHLTYSRYFVA